MSSPAAAVELFYQDVGEGRPVVFLHGWGLSHEVWDRQVFALEHRNRVIAVDLRGHGASPKPAGRTSFADHCADLELLFEGLDVSDAALVGWSVGGGIAAYFAARSQRVGQLVLVGATPRFIRGADAPYGRDPEACEAFIENLRTRREWTMRRTIEDTFNVEMGEAVHQWLYQLSVRAPMYSVIHCFEGLLEADVRPELIGMAIPVLLLHGVYDIPVSIEAARWGARNIPTVRLIEFSDSGHAPFLEKPDKFNAALIEFLDRR